MASVYKRLQDELRQEAFRGTTYQELAERGGVTKGHIARLLNEPAGERLAKLSFESICKLYPFVPRLLSLYLSEHGETCADNRATAAEEVFAILHKNLKSRSLHGMTNRELALMANTSQPHINRLLNGSPSQLGKLKAETLLGLFPKIKELLLNHAEALVEEMSTLVANISIPHTMDLGRIMEVHQAGATNNSDAMRRLAELASWIIASEELSPEAKLQAMSIIHAR